MTLPVRWRGAAPGVGADGSEPAGARSPVAWLQWGRAWVGADGSPRNFTCCSPAGFNGAAPGWARMAAEAPAARSPHGLLQWGRARVGADGSRSRRGARFRQVLQWGRARVGAD